MSRKVCRIVDSEGQTCPVVKLDGVKERAVFGEFQPFIWPAFGVAIEWRYNGRGPIQRLTPLIERDRLVGSYRVLMHGELHYIHNRATYSERD
jgi:hypothetical protein